MMRAMAMINTRNATARFGAALLSLAIGVPAVAQAGECTPLLGWAAGSQTLRTPDCAMVKLPRPAGQSPLKYSSSHRFDFRYLVDSDIKNAPIVQWIGQFCTHLGTGAAVYERRARITPGKHAVFFACRPETPKG